MNFVDNFSEKIIKSLRDDLSTDVDKLVKDFSFAITELQEKTLRAVDENVKKRLFVPNLPLLDNMDEGNFMQYTTCSTADFLHPMYRKICKAIHAPPVFHRKHWEWVFIAHKLMASGLVRKGCKGLGFGVGNELLPAYFASMGASVTATDAPPEIGAAWIDGQYADSIDMLRNKDILSDDDFDELVSFRYVDMKNIDSDLNGFDFVWSSCCFEHLGSLEAGIKFVIDSVEKTLRPGGIAVHTTEFNLSSNDDTVGEGGTVIYRQRDILNCIERLQSAGHYVEPFRVAPDVHFADYHVDVPPYSHNPHVRLLLEGYVTTSVGIVVRKRQN